MTKYCCNAATDVTGFGILGHAQNLAEAQKDDVTFTLTSIPVLKGMVKADEQLGNMFSQGLIIDIFSIGSKSRKI